MANVVFFGSPDFALPTLSALLPTEYRPVLIVTQPDRPAGRGKKLSPTPVKCMAEENHLPVLVVGTLKDPSVLERLSSIEPDFFVVSAFGLILPPSLLRIARRGNINVHASLLPAYRGASPINRAIINGDSFSGVTTMEMERALDAGPIYLQRAVAVDPMENAGELSVRLAQEGASLLLETLRAIETGNLEPVPQPKEGISDAPRLSKADGLIPWGRDAVAVHNHIRGMNPWPGSFTNCRGGYLKIHEAEPADLLPRIAPPGTVIRAGAGNIMIAAGRGAVRIKRLQVEGKRALDTDEFLRGFQLAEGEVLEGGISR
jgi:methionyl-tRNA formyltransferase